MDRIIKGVADAKDFDVLEQHAYLQEKHGPGALTIEASSNPVQVVWKFTPASEPNVYDGGDDEIEHDPTTVTPVAG